MGYQDDNMTWGDILGTLLTAACIYALVVLAFLLEGE